MLELVAFIFFFFGTGSLPIPDSTTEFQVPIFNSSEVLWQTTYKGREQCLVIGFFFHKNETLKIVPSYCNITFRPVFLKTSSVNLVIDCNSVISSSRTGTCRVWKWKKGSSYIMYLPTYFINITWKKNKKIHHPRSCLLFNEESLVHNRCRQSF